MLLTIHRNMLKTSSAVNCSSADYKCVYDYIDYTDQAIMAIMINKKKGSDHYLISPWELQDHLSIKNA